MKLITFAILLTTNFAIGADFPFNGAWSGKGTLSINDEKSNCDSVHLVIDQRDKAFLVKTNLYLCGPNGVAIEGMSLGVQNGNLYLGQDVVGSYTDKEIRYDIDQIGGTYKANWNGVLTIQDGTLHLQQRKTVKTTTNTEITVGEAVLQKAN